MKNSTWHLAIRVYHKRMMLSAKGELPSTCDGGCTSSENGREYAAQIRLSQVKIVVMEDLTISESSDWMGSMKDTIQIIGDMVSPANDEAEWEVLQDSQDSED
jgi:hypothetical protein